MIEGDANGYSAYVSELPSILVTGQTADELMERAAEAVRVYWAHLGLERSPTSTLREIEVEVPV